MTTHYTFHPTAPRGVGTVAEGTDVEEWRAIAGFGDRYEVSNQGRVRTLVGPNAPRVRALKKTRDGYPRVDFLVDGVSKSVRVHVLVAEAFLGPRPEGAELVRHLDGDKTNNRPSNLAFGTRKDNGRDARRLGEYPLARRTHCIHGHEFTPENTRWRVGTNTRLCRQCAAEWQRNKRRVKAELRRRRGDSP